MPLFETSQDRKIILSPSVEMTMAVHRNHTKIEILKRISNFGVISVTNNEHYSFVYIYFFMVSSIA